MELVMFTTALLMMIVAVSFAAKPLVVAYERRSSGSAKLSLLGIVVVFALAVALYSVIGKPEYSTIRVTRPDTATSAQASQQVGQSDKVGSVTSLLSGLEARLAENPDDAKGWLLLAKSYDHLGRTDAAADAYAKAAALGMTDTDLEARLSVSTDASASSVAEIHGHVSVSAAVADRVDPGDTVYVIAKTDANPMPLAVLRRSAAELPFDFVLSDENSMVKGGGISNAATVTISARLSKTGDALNTAAELGASHTGIDPKNAGDLALVIDVVPGG